MVKHICPKCLKEFKRKVDLIYHTDKKKKPCIQIPQNPPESPQNPPEIPQNPPKYVKNFGENSKFYCNFCNSSFKRKDHLKRHIDNRCKIKKQIDEEENNKEELKRELENQSKQIEELKKKLFEIENNKNSSQIKNQQNIQTQNNNCNNNIVNNIIVPYGSELDKIELGEVLNQMLTYNFKDILPNMAKHIYLNKDKPQNKNFRVLDLARNKCEYYDGNKWIAGRTNDELLKMFENVNSLIIDPFGKNEIEKTLEFIRKNETLKNKYKTIITCKNYCLSLFDETDKENLEARSEILNELKLIFYNNKDEILKINLV